MFDNNNKKKKLRKTQTVFGLDSSYFGIEDDSHKKRIKELAEFNLPKTNNSSRIDSKPFSNELPKKVTEKEEIGFENKV